MINFSHAVTVVVFLCLLGTLACGDSAGGEPLNCEAIEADDFCWTTSVAEALECFEGAASAGQLNAERTLCSYTDGPLVHFDQPLVEEVRGQQLWQFTVERDGDSCATFSESDSSQSLETASGLFEVASDGSALTVVCPDGTRYRTGNPLALLECEGGLSSLPGTVKTSGGSVVGFGFTGAAGNMGSLWRCESAP